MFNLSIIEGGNVKIKSFPFIYGDSFSFWIRCLISWIYVILVRRSKFICFKSRSVVNKDPIKTDFM